MKSLLYLFYIGALLLMSCANQDDKVVIAPSTSRVTLINESPTITRNIELYTSKTVTYTNGNSNNKGNLAFGDFASTNPSSGLASLRLRLSNALQDYIFKDVQLEPYNYYSAIVANTDPANMDTAATTGVIFTKDDMSLPATGNAKVRFINLAVGSPAVDLYVYNGSVSTPLYANKGYLQTSSGDNKITLTPNQFTETITWGFQELAVPTDMNNKPAPIQFTFELRMAGAPNTDPPLVQSKQSLITGRFYTIIANGYANPTAESEKGPSIQVVEQPYPNY